MRPENMQTPETPRGSGSGLDIEKIIDRAVNTAVNSTVIKLKMSGLMKDDRKTAYQKTEELLRNYNIFCEVDNKPYTQKMVRIINEALEDIRDDIYYEIIPLYYFKGWTREAIADHFRTTERTISRNKNRLINRMKARIFSDSVIRELFS